MFRRFVFIFAFLLSATAPVAGIADQSATQTDAETISLEQFLIRANAAGIRAIYSSNLISRSYRVTVDPGKEITIEKLKQALRAFDLQLNKINETTYTVTRRPGPESQKKVSVEDLAPLELKPEIEEIIVSSSRYHLQIQKSFATNSLTHDQMVERPAVGNDVVRLVNQLPGSASVGISARPNVRGGNENETLISFDGLQLYEPFHFNHYNNLFGSFDSRIIDSFDFHSGGFSAKYGDRLSAVMLVNTRTTQELLDTREVGVGLFNLSYLQAGGDLNQDWLINIRRSTVELATGLSESDLGKPAFADLYGRYGWDQDNGNRISLNLFWFGDDIELNNSSMTEVASNLYGNTYLWLKSEYNLSDTLYVESIVSVAATHNDRKGQVEKPNLVAGKLSDDREFRVYNLKQDYEYLPSSSWMLTFGWDYRYVEAQYRFASELAIDPIFQQISNYDRPAMINTSLNESGHQYALYGSFKWAITPELTTEFGLRFDAQNYAGSSQSEQFNPRLSLLYRFSPTTEFRLGWGAFSQAEGIHELKIGDGQHEFQSVQKATNLVAGLDQALPLGLKLRFEVYRKNSSDANIYYQNLTNPLSLVPELQADRFQVDPRRVEATGQELTLSGRWRGLEFWGNYSYSSVEDVIADQSVPRSWDQTQSGNVGFVTTIRGWRLAWTGTFHKGWLTTPLNLTANTVSVGDRNSDRFDGYISWDVKFNRSWIINGNELRVEAGITNIFNRDNQVGVEYEVEDGELLMKPKDSLPLAPFFDLYWRF